MKKLGLLLILAMLTQGCAAVLVGGLFYNNAKNKQARQQWTMEFNRMNEERERNRKKPLNWCLEAVKFDKGWAMKNPSCRQYFPEAEKELPAYKNNNPHVKK